MREVTHRYVDPLEAIWVGCAQRIGFRVVRTSTCYASTDGKGNILLGTPETLDADDCLAQMILHELCHALVQGAESLEHEDWGLDNQTDRDVVREHGCLRLQAALTDPHGLRQVLAPTTEYRAFYDALPADPLTPTSEESVVLARRAAAWSEQKPFSPHLGAALAATTTVLSLSNHLAPRVEDAPPLLARTLGPVRARHRVGFPLARRADEMTEAARTPATCGACAWRYVGGAGKKDRCRQAQGARVERTDLACERFERFAADECLRCGACCREAYGAVHVSRRDPVVARHPELIQKRGRTLEVVRDGERCAALDGGRAPSEPYTCRIYADRPRTCRDFTEAGVHCLTARRRVGLSR